MLQPIPSFLAALFFTLSLAAPAQNVPQQIASAFERFEKDPQLQSAISSLYVTDASGTVVFEKNATVGLAPASTQKIITSATAYELLGKDFRYKTDIGFKESNGRRSLYIGGSGDPTLGSWRWSGTKEAAVLNRIAAKAGTISFNDTVYIQQQGWAGEAIPGGWIWDDIGNYYGAGAGVFNWRENQFDVSLRSGSAIGSAVVINHTDPVLYNYSLQSKVVAATKGSGDNAYIYFPLNGGAGVVRGTIPVNENRFVISGALPHPEQQFATEVFKAMHNTKTGALYFSYSDDLLPDVTVLHTEVSPPLDSIIYWFNKRSINLYGEALLKTIGFVKRGAGSTQSGMDILKSYWSNKGIPKTALNLVDGSGLSPLNRITTQAQVMVLNYARKQSWFPGFYLALPEYNGMKLKSGTIHGVKGFAGYHTSRSGTAYTISFLVNNYNGSESELVKKMFAVLDVLK